MRSRARTGVTAPVEVLSSSEPPLSTMHVYGQPADQALFHAQQAFAAECPWFEVHRVDAQSHFPQFETPDELGAEQREV